MTIDQAKLYMCEDRIDFESCLGRRAYVCYDFWMCVGVRCVWCGCCVSPSCCMLYSIRKKKKD